MDICQMIDLSNWKKQQEIIEEYLVEYGRLITSREWRLAVEKWNEKFLNKEVPFYITHSNSLGYKATTNYKEAKIGRNDYVKRAVNMLKKARNCDLAFEQILNYEIDFETGELK